MPWLTPDDTIGAAVAYVVYIPLNLDLESALHGALLDLENEANWELFGERTPAECAEAWRSANELTFPLQEVPP